jgi:hypothetical protein
MRSGRYGFTLATRVTSGFMPLLRKRASTRGLRAAQDHSGLLGVIVIGQPEPMHAAMREGPLAIAPTPGGDRTWGAYQHYGNPYFRVFEPTTMSFSTSKRETRSISRRPAAKKKPARRKNRG